MFKLERYRITLEGWAYFELLRMCEDGQVEVNAPDASYVSLDERL